MVSLVSRVCRAELVQLVLKDSPADPETKAVEVQMAHRAELVSLELLVRKACEETLVQPEQMDSADLQDLPASQGRSALGELRVLLVLPDHRDSVDNLESRAVQEILEQQELSER